MNNQWFSKIAVWMVIAMVLFTVFKQFDGRTTAGAGYVGYSDFLDEVKAQRVSAVLVVFFAVVMVTNAFTLLGLGGSAAAAPAQEGIGRAAR